MAKASFPSDTITFKASTGGNSAGNGGDGYNKGDISNNPSVKFEPTNKAEGADVNVKNGDHVAQKAYWDAGGANAKAEKYSKAEGGKANSNGDQESDSGHNKSDVDANTKAVQDNWLACGAGSDRDGRRRRRRRRPQQGGRWRHLFQGQHRIREPERRA